MEPSISKKEERALLERWKKDRDYEARNLLISYFDLFVFKEVRKYLLDPLGKGADLTQAGRLGLIMAADKFDLAAGTRFITYAKWWVQAYIANEFHNRFGVNKHRRNTGAELLSLDGPIFPEDGSNPAINNFPDPEAGPEIELGLTESADYGRLRQAISCLSQEERLLIELRYFSPDEYTLTEVGKMLDPPVSREWVRKKQERALARLRRILKEWEDKEDFLAALREAGRNLGKAITLRAPRKLAAPEPA